ncbi:MAG: molybdopterin molybdotransferase [Spirosomataceae bacterium]|jgi:molybdopterin molybdotransferase
MNLLISVEKATQIILNQRVGFGAELVSIDAAFGRTLAESLLADRDFPPFDRVTMDGIAINFQPLSGGQQAFTIEATQTAGEPQLTLQNQSNCIEVMTGASLPIGTDTVIRYEDLKIENGLATINAKIRAKQNVHRKGEDHSKNVLLIPANTVLRSPELAVAATVGKSELRVKKLPKVAVITSGDELVNVNETPLPHQIRHSNSYSIAALLQPYGISPTHFHIADNFEETKSQLKSALENFDVLILSGGVSMGKKDFIPDALAALDVEKLFHKLAQRPGKPFWFGKSGDKTIFALPGNPVSTFVCVRRYFIPWLRQNIGLEALNCSYAKLKEEITFKPSLSYFLQVKITTDEHATQWATPVRGNGSGDFVNLSHANGFIELPQETMTFEQGEVYRIWRF